VNDLVEHGVDLMMMEIPASPFHDPVPAANLDSAIAVA
jgi:hypothetical protein